MTETYEVRVAAHFSAVHQLRLGNGGLEPLHGHDWRVEAVFRGPRLDGQDMLIDFEVAARGLEEVLADLNHTNLNTVSALADRNPSAEAVARMIFNALRGRLGPQAPLAAVEVEEAPGCVAAYSRSDS